MATRAHFQFLFSMLAACLLATSALAQSNAYQQTNLVSDMAGSAAHTDPLLVNPWGIAFIPGQPFWVAGNNSGFSQLYDASGVAQAPASVKIPPPAGSSAAATPTGVVYNATGEFQNHGAPTTFLFATEDGTVSTWYTANGSNAVMAFDHSASGAVYKGLAILTPSCCAPILAVTNFHSGLVETYTGFSPVAPPGSFTDPNLPAGFAPFNIQPIGNQVFVTYAVQDTAKHDPVKAAGNGIVSVFNPDGTFVKRFATGGPLNAPWGVVQASASFGAFSNDILIGNFGDGVINAFDPTTGAAVGQLKDGSGAVITNSGLWGMVFGAGGTGDPNTLYFSAGLNDEQHGLFGTIAVASNAGAPDFSVGSSSPSATVAAGSSAMFTLTATPVAGFTGNVGFSCTAPAGITCSFQPASVPVDGAPAMSTLTVMTSANVSHYGQRMGTFLLTGFGLFGLVFVSRKRIGSRILRSVGLLVILTGALALFGCSGYSSPSSSTNRGTASVLVTAQSGAVSHNTTISITVQ
jgi:uncharacterized protein (TIGR03118 family)